MGATLCLRDVPLLDALAAAAVNRIGQFNTQGIANTAWAFAKLSFIHEPFFNVIASASLAKTKQFDPQGLANIAWSMATIAMSDEPLLTAISVQAVGTISQFTTQNLSNTIWAYATLKVWLGDDASTTRDGGGWAADVGTDDSATACPPSIEELIDALGEQGCNCVRVRTITAAYGDGMGADAVDVDATVAAA